MSSLKSPFRIGPDVVMPADGGFSLGAFIDSTEGGEGNIARVVECRVCVARERLGRPAKVPVGLV